MKKIILGFISAVFGLIFFTILPVYASETVFVSNLQPSWDTVGGGGVYSVYYGPNDNYAGDSPGVTTVYRQREAAPISAGLTIDPTYGDYEDQGLFAFKPGDVSISTFAKQPLTYSFVNQYGTHPVWVYIELNKGLAGDIMYQYVPTSDPLNWHTEDAANGAHWQAWTDLVSGITTGPMLSLSDIAKIDPSKTVSRVYLTEGMGNAYHDNPNGTVAWVDAVRIGPVTYDFVVNKERCKDNGWRMFGNPTFKNQGQCIDYIGDRNKGHENDHGNNDHKNDKGKEGFLDHYFFFRIGKHNH